MAFRRNDTHKLCPFAVAVLLAAGVGACGSKKSSTTTPTTTATLTASFTTNCVSCHGSDGSSVPPQAAAGRGVLKGTALTEATFESYVRNGIPGTQMAAFTETQMSTADIQTNYAALTTK